ncbi:MAG: hypothetical protein AAF645_13165 [Myxococcota bacterium]
MTVEAGERSDVATRIGSPASTLQAVVNCELQSRWRARGYTIVATRMGAPALTFEAVMDCELQLRQQLRACGCTACACR